MNRVLFLAFGGWVLLTGCATLPKDFLATESRAISQSETTTLGGMFQGEIERHPAQSGFAVMNTGREALMTRLALADVAERTIDAQYFIWNGDASGILLIDRLIKAANRGVRVRLLIDDTTSHGKDLGLAVLNQHPNIEIRVFNPLGRRYYSGLFRSMAMAFHIGRMTNRMHNKIFAVDNQAALLGGRNIGDEYFGVSEKSNFRDLDLYSEGPIVADVSKAFDDYWNSPWSVPFEIFKTHLPSEKKSRKFYRKMEQAFQKAAETFPFPLDWRRETVLETIKRDQGRLIWATAEVVSDPPGKAWTKAQRGASKSAIVNRLARVVESAKNELVVVSPYLILGEGFEEDLKALADKGVSVKILTNSLRSTDALPVVAMYRPMRAGILRSGAQLNEMRPDAASRRLYTDPSRQKSRMSLHAKTMLLDRRTVFVGTFNLDPRSEHLNTEVGLLVTSEELARSVGALLDVDFSPENSYALQLNKKQDILWHSANNGCPRVHIADPEAGFWRRTGAFFFSILPIRGQL